MLRPTNSPIIFIQQLGRGLRKHEDKTFLTVLDFIGNHNKAFLIAIALNGARYYDKDSLKVSVANQFSDMPGCTNIQMDRICEERILEQLNTENFNSMKYLKEEYKSFKIMNAGKVPYLLMDYIKYDGAPDPLRFLNKHKTYQSFVAYIEKDDILQEILANETFFKVLKELSDKLPIKRIYEFCIIKYLLKHDYIILQEAKNEVSKYIDGFDDEYSILHAFEVLSRQYYDSSQIRNTVSCFEIKKGALHKTEDFKKITKNKKYSTYIEDIINYGLIRYEEEYGSSYYGVPFLKLYSQYKMVDMALLSNYNKIHSSFRGSGLITNKNEYFLFIDLHKGEDVAEHLAYKDEFIDRKHFQWETPNTISQLTPSGQNIIHNRKRGINLHILVRKYKTTGNMSRDF